MKGYQDFTVKVIAKSLEYQNRLNVKEFNILIRSRNIISVSTQSGTRYYVLSKEKYIHENK